MDFPLKLKLNNISHTFGNKFFLFKDISFEMSQSETVAICGPNGSGKSTLLKIIASLLKPSKGSVELSINSKNIERENFYKHISFIAPYLNLYEEFSALEHIKICNEFLAKTERHSEQSEESRKSPLPPFFKGGKDENCNADRNSEQSEEYRKSPLPPFFKGGKDENCNDDRHSEQSEESRKSPLPPFFKGGIVEHSSAERHSERSEESREGSAEGDISGLSKKSPLPPFFKGGIVEHSSAERHSEQSEESREGSAERDSFSFSQSNYFMEKKHELLELLALKKNANEPIKTYSSGQKQRLKYVLALLKDSSIYLLDEPFTNLDENGINIVKEIIANLIKDNRIVVIASNDRREIELSKKIVELK